MKLRYSMLSDAEKKNYVRLVNSFYTDEALQSQERAEKYFRRGMNPVRYFLTPASATIHLSRSLWFYVKVIGENLVQMTGGGGGDEAWVGYGGYLYWFRALVKRHNCDGVDWSTFPNPPWRLQFNDSDFEVYWRVDDAIERGEDIDQRFFK